MFARTSKSGRTLIGAAILAALAGCSGAAVESDTASDLGEVPATPTPDVRETVVQMQRNRVFPSWAADQIVGACMRRAGLTYASSQQAQFDTSAIHHDYGTDLESASRQGYWDPDLPEFQFTVDRPTFPSEVAEKKYWLTYFGPDDSPSIEVDDVINGGRVGEERLDYVAQRENIEDRYFSAAVVTFADEIDSTRAFFDSAAEHARSALREHT